jgi:PAS domain-containing protein
LLRDALDLERRSWRVLFDASADAMVTADAAGVIRRANAAAERLFGYGQAELVGRPVEMLMPAGVRDGHAPHDPKPDHQASALTTRAHRALSAYSHAHTGPRRGPAAQCAAGRALSAVSDDDRVIAVFAPDALVRRRRHLLLRRPGAEQNSLRPAPTSRDQLPCRAKAAASRCRPSRPETAASRRRRHRRRTTASRWSRRRSRRTRLSVLDCSGLSGCRGSRFHARTRIQPVRRRDLLSAESVHSGAERHGRAKRPGASQIPGSCKHESSSHAAGGRAAGIGQNRPRWTGPASRRDAQLAESGAVLRRCRNARLHGHAQGFGDRQA